jgi:hypothetical protein
MFALGQSAQALEILNEPTPSPSSSLKDFDGIPGLSVLALTGRTAR